MVKIIAQTYYPTQSLPIGGTTLWADTFSRANGAPGTTEVGALAYVTTAGSGGAFGVVDGQLAVTGAASGAGYCTVTPSTPRSLLIGQIAVQESTTAPGGIVFRFGDPDNHLVLARVSSSDRRWRLVKRLAGATSQVAILGQPMGSGDILHIDDRVVGKLRIAVNGVIAFNEESGPAVSDLLGNAAHGAYISGMAVSSTRWDAFKAVAA